MSKKYRGKSYHKSRHISANSDNRKYCVGASRQKFCYETYEKARRACEYSPNPQRVYYCDFCCAYHTTRLLNRSLFYTTQTAKTNQLIRDDIKRREILRDKDKPKSIATRKRDWRSKIRKYHYPQVIEEYLVERLSKPTQPDQLILVKAKLFEIIKNLKDPYDPGARYVVSETLKWPFRSIADAIKFFILLYLDKCGRIMAKEEDGILGALFYLDAFSHTTLNKVNMKIVHLLDEKVIISIKNSDGATIYRLSSTTDDE